MPAVAAGLSGVLIAACFLRFQLFPLAWLAFVPLLWALDRAPTSKAAARLGAVAGLTTNIPAFYWLVYTIHVFGGFGYPLALFFYLALSCYTTCEFVLFAIARQRTGSGPLALAAPLLWVTLEFLFPNLFPWRMANSQFHAPVLLQIGDLTGPFGLSFVMLWVSAAVAELFAPRRRSRPLVAAAAATAAVIAYGGWRLPVIEQAMATAPSFRVALVQGDVSIEEKGDIKYFDVNLGKYRELSDGVQDTAEVIVWPETVSQHWIPTGADQLGPKEDPYPGLRSHLIFGGLAYRQTGPETADEFNSAFLLGPGGTVLDRYDKRILMPFGEYLPLASYFPFIRSLSPQTGGFTAGRSVAVFDIADHARIGQLICYEDLVSDMPRHSTRAGADVLLNILNDAWYGDSAAPYQHQALALWRAVENRRFLLRGSNSGVTSIIDAAGRVVAQGGLFTAEVVTGTVPRLHVATVYTRVGDVFAWLVVLGAAALLWRTRRQSDLAQ